jgi:hypothetical protein
VDLTPWPPLPSPHHRPGEGGRLFNISGVGESSLDLTIHPQARSRDLPLSRLAGGRWERGSGGEVSAAPATTTD